MYSQDFEELVSRLYEIVENWEQRRSYSGDISRDIGIEETYTQCVEDLREILERL